MTQAGITLDRKASWPRGWEKLSTFGRLVADFGLLERLSVYLFGLAGIDCQVSSALIAGPVLTETVSVWLALSSACIYAMLSRDWQGEGAAKESGWLKSNSAGF